MRVLKLELNGHLTVEQLENKLAAATDSGDHSPISLLIDCSAMTGYDSEARRRFMGWHRTSPVQIDRSAVVTERRMWQLIVAAMAGVSRRPLQAFSEASAAMRWLTGGEAEVAAAPPVIAEGGRAEARGSGILTAIRAIQDCTSKDEWSRIQARLDPSRREQLRSIQSGQWYPLEVAADLHRAHGETCFADDPVGHEQALVAIGTFIARDNLATLLRLTVLDVDVVGFVNKIPVLWARYYTGMHVEVSVQPEQRTARVEVHGAREAVFLEHIVRGWMTEALRQTGVGAPKVHVRRALAADAGQGPDLELRLEWREPA